MIKRKWYCYICGNKLNPIKKNVLIKLINMKP